MRNREESDREVEQPTYIEIGEGLRAFTDVKPLRRAAKVKQASLTDVKSRVGCTKMQEAYLLWA